MSTAEYVAQKFYTPTQAAPLMRISLRTLRSLIRTGKIRTSKGKTKFIAESEVARYLGMEEVANARQ